MKSKILILILIIFSHVVYVQNGTVIFKISMNGKELTDEPKLRLEYSGNIAKLTNIIDPENMRVKEEATYFDYANKKTYQSVEFKDGRRFTSIDSFVTYPKPELTEETQTIQGYNCRKAIVVIRSNHIDLWYTTDAEIKGTPGINIGPELGLVLKVVRNGNYVIEAENVRIDSTIEFEINGVKTIDSDWVILMTPRNWGEMVSLPEYRYRVTENNYITYKVFTDEKINFGDTIINPPDDLENITYRYSNGTVLLKKIKLPEKIADNLVFAEITERSRGDAYDRTGSAFVIPVNKSVTFLDALKKGDPKILPEYQYKYFLEPYGNPANKKHYHGFTATGNYDPPIELVRFFTPFGIGAYNEQVKVWGIKWEDSVTYKQDITDLIGTLQGEVWIGIFIGCYDKGGHEVSLNLKYHPFDLNQTVSNYPKFWIQPVVNTVNIMEMSGQEYGTVFSEDTLKVEVNIPEGLKSLKLRYISTGHGGWDGGDEFNPKMNEIFLDNARIYNYIPWRSDCGSFRKYNPATGNFPIGVSSSDFSRSGWCPGTATNPIDIPIDIVKLKPGKHVVKVFIPMGKSEGTSFSAWNVSACFIGEYK